MAKKQDCSTESSTTVNFASFLVRHKIKICKVVSRIWSRADLKAAVKFCSNFLILRGCLRAKELACPEISFKAGVLANKLMPFPERHKSGLHLASCSHALLLAQHNVKIAAALEHISKQAA